MAEKEIGCSADEVTARESVAAYVGGEGIRKRNFGGQRSAGGR